MLTPNLWPEPAAEKRQLLVLGIGLAVMAAGTCWFFGSRIPSLVLIVLAAVALAGLVAYRAIGRDVFLVFMLLSLAIGHVVSWVVVLVLYAVVIAGLGAMLRLFGMNRLERNFEACRKKESMLADVVPLDAASFGRQS